MGEREIEEHKETESESESCEESATCGIPRGGPIYSPSMVGHLSTIPEFQSSFLNLLQDLETHLSPQSSTFSQQYDISTDILKIYTEEELTEMAMKEAFKEDNLELEQSLNTENPATGSRRKTKRHKTVKKTVKKTELSLVKKIEEPYVAKVEQLAKIKQKQEEDKTDVRLHCFRKTCKSVKDESTCPEGFEQMQYVKYIDKVKQLVKPSEIQMPTDTLFPEVILCVEVYDNRKVNGHEVKVKTQEFLVLGRQMLSELKDKIHCLADQAMKKAGVYDPSGYFLIEDVFHNDLRNPSATDYSKPIIDWLWNSKDEAHKKWECISTGELKRKQKAVLGEAESMTLPRFESAEMQSTRFCDLRFKVGASYIYCHQGDCKHKIVIRDMRLSHPEDVQERGVYPRLMFQLKPRIQKCNVCNITRASKIAVNDKWGNENRCYFCDSCLACLHFQEGGSLNSDFTLYDYIYTLYD